MNLCENLNRVKAQINTAEQNNKRPLNSVLLLAVSKQRDSDTIIKAYELGMRHFGESYLQEALQLENLCLLKYNVYADQCQDETLKAALFDMSKSKRRDADRIKQLLEQSGPKYFQ